MKNCDFDEYLKAGEPSQREKAYAWATAIGLQQVDELTPSDYLIQTGLLVPPKREQVRKQVKEQPSKFVVKLVKVIKGEMSTLEMMIALGLAGRRNFLEKYLTPAIDGGYVEMTQPDSARSPTQRYRLTAKGEKTV